MSVHHIHISVPNGGEFAVGPFGSEAEAKEKLMGYPEEVRAHCTVADDHVPVGTVFPPEVGVETLLFELEGGAL